MLRVELNKRALTSIVIFVIIILKDFLVSYLGIILERSSLNKAISWGFILLLSILGVVFSIQVILENYSGTKENKRFIDANLILSIPC